MRFSLLLYLLYRKLRQAASGNKVFQSYIGNLHLKILIKTADEKRGRLFIFDKGRVFSRSGARHGCDAALVWSDPATAFRTMIAGNDAAVFKTAAEGKLKREKSGVVAPPSSLLGCLGTGIPFAMAAKLSRPDKHVLLLQGDGSFGFNAMEFDTMIRHNIPVVCVINNDSAWGMIKHSQELSIGPDRLQCAELGERHYEKVVAGLGGYGEFVTRDEDIIPAINRALESGKPSCINVLTDPTAMSPATPMFYQSLKME